MKRVLALLLTALMLAAMFPASVVSQAETVTKEGFYLVNWERGFDTGKYGNVYWMPYTWIDSKKFDSDSQSINIGMYFDGYSSSNVKLAASELYDEFRNRPEGTRYINLAALATVFKRCAKNVIDMEDGVRLVSEWLNRFLTEYKAMGGKLDGIAIDLEYHSYTSHYLHADFYSKDNKNIYNDIVANQRVYQKILRPQLVELEKQGLFEFYKNSDPTKYPYRSEIWTIYRYDDYGGKDFCRSAWSSVMQKYLVDCINRAAFEPMIKHYPDAILSDYDTADTYSWHKSMTNRGATTGTTVKAGNASNAHFYGTQFSDYYWATSSGSTTRKLYYKPASYNEAVFDPTDPYTRTLYDVNNVKRLLASTIDKMGEENAHLNVWVPFFHYASTTKSYGNSAYFTELMYHMGMANPEPFLGYIMKDDVAGKQKYYDDPNMGDYTYALQVSDEILAELSRVAGASDRKVIETPMAWNEGYILSGMYAGGRNIWRITPDTSLVSVEDFKVNDYAPVFSVNGLTITFPQGRIIKDTSITQIGSCGYWVETPANVTPVVTSSASRYENAPSFREDFTNYKTGAFAASSSSMVKTTSGLPDTYWTVNGTAEIKNNSGNQTLALSGSTTLTNALVPEKITAGDYYAEQQIWEVKVTLPSGKYGDVKLLSCDAVDGGIKISGGKVYYDQGGAYQELSGVTLSAGTYILKREVDFRNMLECTSKYTICDAAGNRLGGTQMVPMAAVTVPVSKITISTTGAANAVEVDDYKLYPTGVTTVLDLYETARGKKLANTNNVRTEDTAYRLSWMNASDTYQVARVFDAKTGTIIKKIEMEPGTDGVVADVVKVSAGQQIQIAVNVKAETAPTRYDYDNGDFSWSSEVAERIGLAVGEKLDYTGGGDEIPDDSVEDEEGDNIFDIVDGDGDLNNGSGDPIIPNGNGDENSGDAEDPGDGENPDNADAPGATGTPDSDDSTVPAKKGLSGGIIALIVVLSLAVLAGGGVAAYIFIIKPKLAAKAAKEPAEKEPWQDNEQ